MSKRLNFLAAPALALCLAGASFAADAPTSDTVMVTVNGTDITLGHLINMRQNLPRQYDQVDPNILLSGLIDQLISQTLLEQSLTAAPPKKVQIALDNERRTLLSAVVIDDLLAETVTETAIEAAYRDKYEAASPGKEYHASHILVETEDEAKTIVTDLKDGANFAGLAKEKSTGPSGPSGGDLGWFGPGAMVPTFEQAVVDLSKGDISDPVQTQFGWHVITLHDTRLTEAPKLKDVRDQIVTELQTQLIEDHITSLKKGAAIDRTPLGDFNSAILNDSTLLEK